MGAFAPLIGIVAGKATEKPEGTMPQEQSETAKEAPQGFGQSFSSTLGSALANKLSGEMGGNNNSVQMPHQQQQNGDAFGVLGDLYNTGSRFFQNPSDKFKDKISGDR